MQRKLGIVAAILLLWTIAPAAPPAAAQATGELSGVLKDVEGKPFADASLELKHTTSGTVSTAKADKNGRYSIQGLRVGPYEFSIKDPQGEVLLQSKFEIHSGENPLDINLKDYITPEQLAARKKQEEEVKKSHSMKASFDAGRGLMDQADQLRTSLAKTPVEQRPPIQEKMTGLYQNALTDFQQSQAAAGDKFSDLHIIVYNIALAEEGLGKYDDAAADFRKAIELAETGTGKAASKTQLAGYYSNLGNLLGKMGKTDDANKAYEAAAAADPANAGTVWLNSGIVLYRAQRLPEAVVPLQKATELLPKNAQAWFLLGAALVATMEVKQEGEKMIPVLKPGTVEAYQKAIELDPNGPWGTQAKEGLEQLQAMGAGVETKVKVKKGKS